MKVPILKPSCLTREREKFCYSAPTSRTGQIFLIPASRLTLLPHVLKCPNQLSDTLVRGTTTIKTMPRSIFSSTLVLSLIFRDKRQILLADYPASCLCNQDLPSMDSTAPLRQKELASFYGKSSAMTVPLFSSQPWLLCSRCHDATIQSTNSLPPTQSRPTHS